MGKERKMPIINQSNSQYFFHPLDLFGSDTNPSNILQSILACVLLCTLTVTIKLLHFTAETRVRACRRKLSEERCAYPNIPATRLLYSSPGGTYRVCGNSKRVLCRLYLPLVY